MAETPAVATGTFARPLADDLLMLPVLLDKLCLHKPWFDDRLWNDPAVRRTAASRYLATAMVNGLAFVVWRGKEPTGVILATEVNYNTDLSVHFCFFDRTLADKRRLSLNLMARAFQQLDLQVIRTEIPTYASALANWCRRKLGFRFEAEARPLSRTPRRIGDTRPFEGQQLSADEAMLGSRKHRAVLFDGRWHDKLLLSVTREEFTQTYSKEFASVGTIHHSG